MLSSSYPQLDASVANLGILASADEQAIERFKAAYTQYAKALGTNSARPVAISHMVGESGRSRHSRCIFGLREWISRFWLC